MATITIYREKIEKQKGVVILPIKEYERLLALAIPTYHLTGKAADRVDKLVENGLKAYRAGKTIVANSISDALRKYRRSHVR